MEEKKEWKREIAKERELEDGHVCTALFTAGIVLLMVCLKRALVLLLIEQWRAWVFLVLNIVLLAIFFTSTSSSPSQNQQICNDNEEVMKKEKKKKRKQCPRLSSEANGECINDEIDQELHKKRSDLNESTEQEEQENVEDNSEHPKLSKEELNARVEAFIAMFRQHLVLDAIRGRDHIFYAKQKPAEILNLRKGHTEGINCFMLKVQGVMS